MTANKIGRNDPCTCGSGKKFKLCCQRQSAQAAVSPPVIDESTRRTLMEAFGNYQAGRLQEADSSCRKVLRANPRQADALHLSGLVCHQRGENERALELIDRALSLAPNDSMHSNRGIVLQSMGRLDEAAQSYGHALALNEKLPAVHLNLGATLQALGRMDAAAASFRRALAIDPRSALAHSGLGNLLFATGDIEHASECLERALELDPNLAETHTNLGNLRLSQRRVDDAVASYRTALRLNPKSVSTLNNLGVTLTQMNRMDEALAAHQAAYALMPTVDRRIQCELLLPSINESREELLENRARFERNLDRLLHDESYATLPGHSLYGASFFNLAFHGMSERATQEKIARLYEKLCPSLLYEAAHVRSPVPMGRRVRLGFLSLHVHNHPVAHCFSKLIKSLAKQADFDVFLISTQKPDDEDVEKSYPDFDGKWVPISADCGRARETISSLELDILVYQDIGMDEVSYFLAFARLARFQCVMGGHPVTTGIRNIDYFLSSALAEADDADEHYSETLVRLPIGAFFYEHPTVPSPLKGREAFGLPATGALYVCPMMLQKIHPDFDEAIAQILERDPGGHVVLFAHPTLPWKEVLERRFSKTIPDRVRCRVIFLSWVSDYGDFISINALADVVLDPFHFGIGSTAIATFAVGTPIVTWPGPYLRGRVGLTYCKLLELQECVATDADDYVAKAVQLGHDLELREQVKARIRANKHRLYANEQVVHDLTEYFIGLGQRLSEAEASQ